MKSCQYFSLITGNANPTPPSTDEPVANGTKPHHPPAEDGMVDVDLVDGGQAGKKVWELAVIHSFYKNIEPQIETMIKNKLRLRLLKQKKLVLI